MSNNSFHFNENYIIFQIISEKDGIISLQAYKPELQSDLSVKRYNNIQATLGDLITAYQLFKKKNTISIYLKEYYQQKRLRLISISGLELLYKKRNNTLQNNLADSKNIYRNLKKNLTFKLAVKQFFDQISHTYNYVFKSIWKKKFPKENLITVTLKNPHKQLIINRCNVDTNVKYLVKVLNHRHVSIHIDWNNQSKQYQELLQNIALTYLITFILGNQRSIDMFFWFPDDFEFTDKYIPYLSNIANISEILIKLPSFLKFIMETKNIWQRLISSFRCLLLSSYIMDERLIKILKIILKTFSYWELQHVLYAEKIGLPAALAIAMKRAYYHPKRSRNLIIKDATFQIITTFDQLKGTSDEYVNEFVDFKICLTQQKMIKQKKKQQSMNNYLYYISNLKSNINYYIQQKPESLKELDFIRLSKKEMIKICGNIKCQVSKRNKKHYQVKKFYICRGCKLKYYCDKKCQKIDWKINHRFECAKLRKIQQ